MNLRDVKWGSLYYMEGCCDGEHGDRVPAKVVAFADGDYVNLRDVYGYVHVCHASGLTPMMNGATFRALELRSGEELREMIAAKDRQIAELNWELHDLTVERDRLALDLATVTEGESLVPDELGGHHGA